MSVLIAIPKNESCDAVGGVKYAYAINKNEITAVTVGADGEITAITLDVAGESFALLEFDDEDNSAQFNEEGSNDGNQVRFTGEGIMTFRGITQTKIKAANQAKQCCGVVIIWFQYDGTRRVQGIDVFPDGTWQFSQSARVVPSVNSNTGEGEALMTYTVNSNNIYVSPTTTLDETAIEAL